MAKIVNPQIRIDIVADEPFSILDAYKSVEINKDLSEEPNTATVTIYNNADLSGTPLAQTTTAGDGSYRIAFDGTITEPPYVLAEKNDLRGSGQSRLVPSLSSSTSNYYKDLTLYKTVETPEFATIAIPVASILGLLFLFNHRKSRKE